MRDKVLATLVGIVLLGGCANNIPTTNNATTVNANNAASENTANPANPFDRYYTNLTPEPVNTTPISNETQRACHKFTSNLLQRLDKSGENLFFSPFSLMVVLGMTLNGASGETHRQMVQALGYNPDQFDEKAFNQQMHSLLGILKTAGGGVTLHRANGVWVDQSIEPNPDFLRAVLGYYESRVQAADFVNNPRQAAEQINRWVSEQTNSTIDQLFAPQNINPTTAIVLVNALYFEAIWDEPFPSEDTRNATFYLENGKTKSVPMMRNEGYLPYLRGEGFQAVRLSYRQRPNENEPQFSFYLFVPDEGRTVAWLREQWTPENWTKWWKSFKSTNGTILMPRFTLQKRYDLNNALSAMGMRSAFSDGADLRRMTVKETPLWIDTVVQEARVEVDEQGTRAAAASGAVMELSADLHPFTVVADRPFLFAIVHEPTGIVMFLGIVREP